MMKNILLYMLLVLMFFSSCKKRIQEEKNELTKVIVKDTLRLKNEIFDYPEDLFNTKLIGLGIKDSTAVDPYKKYWIDFAAICYGPTITLYIDTDRNKLYAIDYTIENSALEKDEIVFQLNIQKITCKGNNYAIHFDEIEQFMIEDHDKTERIETVFNFIKLNAVYKLEINNELPGLYSEVNRYENFTSKSNEYKFEQEGCGDFDG